MKKASEKKLLVVGGSGFIGNYLVKEAYAKGFMVTVLSLTVIDDYKKIKGIEYINVDISIRDDLFPVIGNIKFNYVVNLAGYVDHSTFFEKGKNIISTHLDGVINLVNCIDRSELKRFVQIGSSDEYGNIAAPQSEESRESPISPYSFAKVAITHFLQMLHRTEAFPSVILRLFIVYGPRQKLDRFIPQVINACIKNQHFPVSEGSQLRDFCYVDDVVQAILMSFDKNDIEGEVLNIGTGIPLSIRSIVSKIQKIAKGGVPKFGEIPIRSGENMALYADISKTTNKLNWLAKTNLDECLEVIIESQMMRF